MHVSGALRPYLTAAGVVIVGASLVAVAPVEQHVAPKKHSHAVTLTGVEADDLGGSQLALIMGPSTIPIPTQGYMDLGDQLYLAPLGFNGDLESLATPEGLYPVTGVKSLPFDTSTTQDVQILVNRIEELEGNGTIDADHPVTVFGWSQSSTASALAMSELKADGVPSEDVRFVLVGDPNNPDGGMLDRFAVPVGGTDTPSAPALGITFSGTTPNDLYPTDIYTNEYDGFADFPKYPIDFLSDINAYLGILFQHIAYLGMSPDQIAEKATGNPEGAILLPGSQADGADTFTNYYMMPDVFTNYLTGETQAELPLLQILQFLPFIGQPVYDLLQPDTSILVNLGYGSIDNGWSPGDASQSTPFGILPSSSTDPGFDWNNVLPALGKGLETGVTNFFHDIVNTKNYDLGAFLDNLEKNPFLDGLLNLTHALELSPITADASGIHDLTIANLLELAVNGLGQNTGFPTSDATIFGSSFSDIVNSITGTISGDYSTLLPIADTANTLLTTFPSLLFSFITDHLDDPLTGIGDALAAGVGLIPFAAIFGAGVPVVVAAGGTLVNIAELLGLGGPGDGSGEIAGLLAHLDPATLLSSIGDIFDGGGVAADAASAIDLMP